MIGFVFLLVLYVTYFLRCLSSGVFLHLPNIFLFVYFVKCVLLIPLLANGFVFSFFENVTFNNELYNIYLFFGYFIILTAIVAKVFARRYTLFLNARKNQAKKTGVLFWILSLYSLFYYLHMRVTPPILAPLFGQNMLVKRLELSYNKAGESVLFYGNTIIKDYLMQTLGIITVFRRIRIGSSFLPVLIYFFLTAYMGRKSTIALVLFSTGISLYNFGYISRRIRNVIFGIGMVSVVLFFVLYGSQNILFDLGVRVFLYETAYSYKHYLYYWNDPTIGMNIFNFPLSESLFGLEFRNIRQEAYTLTFGSRVESSGVRNGQGYAPLILMLGMGKYFGALMYCLIVLLTFLILNILQRSIEVNRNSGFFFVLYFFFLGQANNYLAVNIFSVFDVTLFNYKFLILLSIILYLNKFRIISYVYSK